MTSLPETFAKEIDLFQSPNPRNDWAIVNDSVMGGISTSRIDTSESGNLLFRGTLSLENNGGFASVRSRGTDLQLNQNSALKLRVRGDGRSYYIDLRSRSARMAGSYRASFQTTANEWEEITIPMSSFVAQSFGRLYPNIEFIPSAMNSVGFTLSDKRPGPFQLEIGSIAVVRAASSLQPNDDSTIDPRVALINTAIQRGVPLFNSGNPEACAAIYEIACLALAAMPEIDTQLKQRLQTAIAEARLDSDARSKAWTLRYALDEALERLNPRAPSQTLTASPLPKASAR